MLDNRLAILFIRGERPIIDNKYDILKHPHVDMTPDGKGKEYHHGQVTESVAEIMFTRDISSAKDMETEETYILLSDEEIEELQNKKHPQGNVSAG
ncbi:hypothetical protein ACE5MJ_12020 [Clostridioides difficile]